MKFKIFILSIFVANGGRALTLEGFEKVCTSWGGGGGGGSVLNGRNHCLGGWVIFMNPHRWYPCTKWVGLKCPFFACTVVLCGAVYQMGRFLLQLKSVEFLFMKLFLFPFHHNLIFTDLWHFLCIYWKRILA